MNRRPRALVLAVAAASLVSWALAPAARAQEKPKIPPAQLQKAKQAFERAGAHYEAGRWDEAIAAYQEAYEAAPLPAFHFNLGQAYRLKGDKRKAVEHYQKYLELEPGGEGAVEAQSHLAVLGREIAEEDRAALERRAAEERQRAVEEARRKEREAARAELAATPADAPEPARKGGGTLKIAGLATGGAGLALCGVGAYFGFKAMSLSNDLEALRERGEWDSSIIPEGEAADRNMLIFTGVGAAAVVTGGVLYYMGMRADRAAERVSVVPVVAPDLAGLRVAGRF